MFHSENENSRKADKLPYHATKYGYHLLDSSINIDHN